MEINTPTNVQIHIPLLMHKTMIYADLLLMVNQTVHHHHDHHRYVHGILNKNINEFESIFI